MKAKEKPHYVNNRKFSYAVVEHVKAYNEAKEVGKTTPKIPDYVAISFLKIAEGLSHKSNFIRYTYREEMVMDAVENCLKAILNYNIEAATRTGNPNAFAYFTQICYYAFLRRIAKEKKQQDIKFKFIEKAGIEDLIAYVDENDAGDTERMFVDELKQRIGQVKAHDNEIKKFADKEKTKAKENKKKGLELFMG